MDIKRDPALPGKLMGVAIADCTMDAMRYRVTRDPGVQWAIVIPAMLVLLGLIIGGVL